MGLYLNAPPPKRPTRPRLHRLIEAGSVELVPTVSGFHVEQVHFFQGKRWPHPAHGEDCVPCGANRRLVCYGYLPCWLQSKGEYGVFEVTQRAMERFVEHCSKMGISTLRGRPLTIHRGKGGRTARQWIEDHPHRRIVEVGPEAPVIDVGGLLQYLYMQQGRLSFDKNG